MTATQQPNVIWRPQAGRQKALLDCPVYEIFYGGARGGGKCLPLTEKVLTPFGWRFMGEVKQGQSVCNPDGSISKVISVYRPAPAMVYKLVFSDGASVECDDGHIWLGSFVGNRIKRDLPNKLWTLAEIRKRYEENKDARFIIPLTKPLKFTRPNKNRHGDMLPVDSYLLGVLLGDGSITQNTVRYATIDDEIDKEMARHGTVSFYNGCNRAITKNPKLQSGLKKLGLWGCRSEDKFIPDSYLWASEDVRLAVLQGLMDTDGNIDIRGHCYFASASLRLAEGVQHLARSLGFKATIFKKETTHLDSYNIYIRGERRQDLFRLTRKKARAKKGQPWHNVRRLVSVEPVGIKEIGCFQVDNPNGLFITNDFIVTHNTDGVIGKMGVKATRHLDRFNGVFFRKEVPMLDDAIRRSQQIYPLIGAQWVGYKKTWQFPGGGTLRFRPLENDNDAEKYQGQNLSDVCIEEVGTYPDYSPIAKLHGAIRSGGGGITTQMHMTGNPGGAGQGWLKERFVDPCPEGFKIINEKFPNGQVKQRVFIPALVTDNKILLHNDPNYVTNLYMVGSDALVKAWLEGDWNAVEGAFFDKFSLEKHVIEPFAIPDHWYRIRAFDWGYAAPFCCLWMAVSDGSTIFHGDTQLRYPKGALIVYREWYGAEKANKGLRMENKDIARGIYEREKAEKIDDMVADPAIFANQGGASINEQMESGRIYFRPADNKRIPGWQQIRQRLDGDNGLPMMYIFKTCDALIRTLPAMQHDKRVPEDLDTTSEDHALDTLRYGCMARPYARKKIETPKEWDARIHVKDIVKQLKAQENQKSYK